MQINVTADMKSVKQSLANVRSLVRDKSKINLHITNMLVRRTQLRFKSKIAPDGIAWKKASPVTLKQKGYRSNNMPSGKGLLIGETGVLGSILGRYNKDTIVIGTSAIYGRIHQMGGMAGRGRAVKIPARPFLGVSKSDEKKVLTLIKKQIEKAISHA